MAVRQLGTVRGKPSLHCDNCRSGFDPSNPCCQSSAREVARDRVSIIGTDVGRGFHRSGWPWCLRQLRTVERMRKDLVIDDFAERTIGDGHVHRSPWLCISHYPPDVRGFESPQNCCRHMLASEAWRKSREHLRGVICFSEHSAAFWREAVDVPVHVVRHPTMMNRPEWSPLAWQRNKQRKLVQVGAFLRDTQAIFAVPPMVTVGRARLWSGPRWWHGYDMAVARYWDRVGRELFDGVEQLGKLTDRQYDSLFAKNVILSRVFDTSANNVTLEAIASNTPIFINPHPAAVEYLGRDYPLWFEHPSEIPAMMGKVNDAHRYLSKMDKRFLSGKVFRRAIAEIVRDA